jgi:S1-C subfamily serine protease
MGFFRVKSKLTTAQQTINQSVIETTVVHQTAESGTGTVDTAIAQQTAQLRAVEASVSQQTAQLTTAETAIRTLRTALVEFQSESGVKLVYTNVKDACSQIYFQLGGEYFVGSGWFYYDAPDDLMHGYFVTAAHCVMKVDNGTLHTMSRGFIQDPTTCNWTEIDVSNVFYDGVADIALIKTTIDLTNHPHCGLRLATTDPSAGDTCYVVGNPGGIDEDSISVGCVRDPHYTEPDGYQITDSIHVTCPGMGGNSGGPIVNKAGGVIGIYTFGRNGAECFGGGSNVNTLRASLPVLKSLRHNRQKRYMGFGWFVPSPFLMASYYSADARFRTCVCVYQLSPESPFASILSPGDLLLSAQLPNGDVVEFGNTNEQKTPGVLLYYYEPIVVQITYVKPNRERLVASVTLQRAYEDVSILLDGPLQTVLCGRRSMQSLDRLVPRPFVVSDDRL